MNFIGDAPSIDLAMLRDGVDNFNKSLAESSGFRVARENMVHNVLNNLMLRASVTFTDFVERYWPSVGKSAATNLKDLPRGYDRVQYADIATQQVSTMEGFDGHYLNYGPVVLESLGFYEAILDKQLQSYKLLLGRLITNQKDQESFKTLEPEIKAATAAREQGNTANAAFWSQGSFKSLVPVGVVVERMNDVVDIFATGKAINAHLRRIDVNAIQTRVTDIKTMIQVLLDNIENGGVDKINDTQLKNIAHGVMDLAKSVEYFGLVVYRANIYLTALDRLNAVIAKAT